MIVCTGRNRFNSMESLWTPFKISKTTHEAYIYVCIYQYTLYITNPSGDPVPLSFLKKTISFLISKQYTYWSTLMICLA
jgi:hypothetical protein